MRRRLGPAALAAATVLAVSSPARGQPNEPDWAFSEPAVEPLVAGVCAASLLAYFVPQRRSEWGAYSERGRGDTSDVVSDFTGAAVGSLVLVTTGYFLEAAYYQTAGTSYPFARALKTSMIDVEALALSTGLTAAIKRFSGRCRPRAWKAGLCDDDDESFASFPSGHTSAVSGIAGTRIVLAARTSGPFEFRVAGLAIAETSSVATAILRVTAGAHSWEDVVGGLILGHVTGSLVAIVHPMQTVETPNEATPAPQALESAPVMFNWSGSF